MLVKGPKANRRAWRAQVKLNRTLRDSVNALVDIVREVEGDLHRTRRVLRWVTLGFALLTASQTLLWSAFIFHLWSV